MTRNLAVASRAGCGLKAIFLPQPPAHRTPRCALGAELWGVSEVQLLRTRARSSLLCQFSLFLDYAAPDRVEETPVFSKPGACTILHSPQQGATVPMRHTPTTPDNIFRVFWPSWGTGRGSDPGWGLCFSAVESVFLQGAKGSAAPEGWASALTLISYFPGWLFLCHLGR